MVSLDVPIKVGIARPSFDDGEMVVAVATLKQLPAYEAGVVAAEPTFLDEHGLPFRRMVWHQVDVDDDVYRHGALSRAENKRGHGCRGEEDRCEPPRSRAQ